MNDDRLAEMLLLFVGAIEGEFEAAQENVRQAEAHLKARREHRERMRGLVMALGALPGERPLVDPDGALVVWTTIASQTNGTKFHAQRECSARGSTIRVPLPEPAARRAGLLPCHHCIVRLAQTEAIARSSAA